MQFDLDRPYALDDEQIDFFRSNGFVRLKEVFGAKILEHYGEEISRLTLAHSKEKPPLAERSTYGKAFLQVTNLWKQSERAREFVFARRLARIAAELLEVRGGRLYHDQALIKEPGGGFTPAHADQFYWPLASDRAVTAWVPLQSVPADAGPIGFYAEATGSSSRGTCRSPTRASERSHRRWKITASCWSTIRSRQVKSASTSAGRSTVPDRIARMPRDP